MMITDLDFADDIALLSDEISQAQELLLRVESACKKTGLGINAKKTKIITYNIQGEVTINTNDGQKIDLESDFKYLGSWIDSTDRDIKARKAQAWRACNNMKAIWKSPLSSNIKRDLFFATVESVLLYGCEAWTLTSKQEKSLDGCYTRMLRMVYNIRWDDYISNQMLYGTIPKITDKIRRRRLKFAGHCVRQKGAPVCNLILWEPLHGYTVRGRPQLSYVDSLRKDTGLTASELKTCMEDRKSWRTIIVRGPHST